MSASLFASPSWTVNRIWVLTHWPAARSFRELPKGAMTNLVGASDAQ
jgi:hypothetical protein